MAGFNVAGMVVAFLLIWWVLGLRAALAFFVGYFTGGGQIG